VPSGAAGDSASNPPPAARRTGYKSSTRGQTNQPRGKDVNSDSGPDGVGPGSPRRGRRWAGPGGHARCDRSKLNTTSRSSAIQLAVLDTATRSRSRLGERDREPTSSSPAMGGRRVCTHSLVTFGQRKPWTTRANGRRCAWDCRGAAFSADRNRAAMLRSRTARSQLDVLMMTHHSSHCRARRAGSEDGLQTDQQLQSRGSRFTRGSSPGEAARRKWLDDNCEVLRRRFTGCSSNFPVGPRE